MPIELELSVLLDKAHNVSCKVPLHSNNWAAFIIAIQPDSLTNDLVVWAPSLLVSAAGPMQQRVQESNPTTDSLRLNAEVVVVQRSGICPANSC